jgi:hypothetical protein
MADDRIFCARSNDRVSFAVYVHESPPTGPPFFFDWYYCRYAIGAYIFAKSQVD